MKSSFVIFLIFLNSLHKSYLFILTCFQKLNNGVNLSLTHNLYLYLF